MPPRTQRPAPPALGIVLVAVLGVLITLAVTVARHSPGLGESRHGIGVLTVDDLHEGQLEAAAAMVLILCAAVLSGRVRRRPTRRHLMLFTALCMLALDNLVSAMFTAGFDSLAANRFATWTATVNGLIGAVLLVAAAWLPDEPLRHPRRSLLRAVVGLAGFVTLTTVTVWLLRDQLPGAFQTRPVSAADVSLFSEHPSLFVIEAVTACCWAAAAVFLAQLARRSEDELTWWLAMAAALATISSLNYALFPSHYTELLYLGDYFFLLAVTALLIGSVREIGAAEAALVDRALYEERRRIAHEMHDGVAQELSIVATQAHRIQSHPETTEAALRRIQESVGRALDDTRTAIKHLSGPVDESLAAEIGEAAWVITERENAGLELDLDDRVVVAPDVRQALVRVTQDAVSAAVRLAGARHVRVVLRAGGSTTLRVSDDSVSHPSADAALSIAQTSIEERVARIHGKLMIHAESGGGRCVEVIVP